MSIDIRQTTVAEMAGAPAFEALVHAHWVEVGHLQGHEPTIGLSGFRALEQVGMLLLLGVFVSGELVGYSATVVAPHLHYALVTADNTALFLLPEHRRGRVGLSLLAATEGAARAKGARYFTWHARPGSALDRILSRTRGKVQDVSYIKEL